MVLASRDGEGQHAPLDPLQTSASWRLLQLNPAFPTLGACIAGSVPLVGRVR